MTEFKKSIYALLLFFNLILIAVDLKHEDREFQYREFNPIDIKESSKEASYESADEYIEPIGREIRDEENFDWLLYL